MKEQIPVGGLVIMTRYKNIIEKINQKPTNYNFSKLPADSFEKELLIGEIPIDYIDFLREVGFGSISEGYFMFYEGLIPAEEIFDTDINSEIKNIFLFGDNFSGDATGFFRTNNWAIVDIWHEDLSIIPREERTFVEFVNKIISNEL
ncbi:SMI1/KNR4 family protein [Mesobacillus subterraneus]|nr:SMI1/KNR4 family protein [Mesobacillus subterraneus]